MQSPHIITAWDRPYTHSKPLTRARLRYGSGPSKRKPSRACAKTTPSRTAAQVRSRFRPAFPLAFSGRKLYSRRMRPAAPQLNRRGPRASGDPAPPSQRTTNRVVPETRPAHRPREPAGCVPIGCRRRRRCALLIGCGRSTTLRRGCR